MPSESSCGRDLVLHDPRELRSVGERYGVACSRVDRFGWHRSTLADPWSEATIATRPRCQPQVLWRGPTPPGMAIDELW